jgi:hypothetical protein
MQGMTPERFATWMAGQLRQRDNPVFIGIQIGVVSKPLPDIEIKLGEAIVLDKTMLVFARYLLTHTREVNLKSSGVVDSMTPAGMGPHTHDITSLEITGQVKFLDELKPGDEVILMAAQDQQLYYVLDKAVRLE